MGTPEAKVDVGARHDGHGTSALRRSHRSFGQRRCTTWVMLCVLNDVRGGVNNGGTAKEIGCRMMAMVVDTTTMRAFRSVALTSLILGRRSSVIARCVSVDFERANESIGHRHDHHHCDKQRGDKASQSGKGAVHLSQNISLAYPDTITTPVEDLNRLQARHSLPGTARIWCPGVPAAHRASLERRIAETAAARRRRLPSLASPPRTPTPQ